MKVLAAILGALIVLIQYPLWLGKGGWLRAWQLEKELSNQKANNSQREARNAGLAAEVRDLKTGTEALEERARYELGMVRNDEVFFQIVEENRGQSPVSGNAELRK
ncbi:MAG TPA: cell division protein FtsB [Burkholderiales bacterium]|jgi:cell division protein FtsB|nr:cell division protein FtsB [Burkholderiales bacterium]